MTDFGGTDRLLPRADAVEKVLHVVIAGVEAGGRGGQWCGEQFGVVRLDVPARDPNPAVGAMEFHAVPLAVFFDHAADPVIVHSAAAGVGNTIGIGIVDLVLTVSRKAAGNHLDEWLAFNPHGAIGFKTERPKGDVVMMRAPIGHSPA